MSEIAARSHKPHITFGIVTDVQYADCDDGTDFSKTRTRYYRNALNLLKNAVNDWKRMTDQVAFVLQLGDLIDGKNKCGGEEGSQKALITALHPFNCLKPAPTYHIVGNHELYNLPRSFYLDSSAMNPSLSLSIETSPASRHLYYTFVPHPKLRIVNLDTYEVSILGYQDRQEDPNFLLADQLLKQHNKIPGFNDADHLEGLDKRWAAYNGGISTNQLAWLTQVLDKALKQEENVIIMSHIGLRAEYRHGCVLLTWNSEDILEIIGQYPCVVAALAGHDHAGWDFIDPNTGITFITVPAIVETKPDSNAYATARLWDDTLEITGVGRVPSYSIKLKYPINRIS